MVATTNPARESSVFIADNSEHVKIDMAAVEKLSVELAEMSNVCDFNGWNSDLFPHPSNPNAVQWIFVVDVLNFSFWHEPDDSNKCSIRYKDNDYTGYMGLVAAIDRAVDNGSDILTGQGMATMSEKKLAAILLADSGEEMPMLAERAHCLREAGCVLLEKFDGSFENCIRQANGSAMKLLQIIVDNFPAFRDEANYRGRRVQIYKRAQILIADIWTCFTGGSIGTFNDIDSLTMFADYRIPQVLAYYGVLVYSPELAKLLEVGFVFKSGASMEVEIRGCTIRAVDLLSDALSKKLDKKVPVIQIDHYLWNLRRDLADEFRKIPFHKVRCSYY